MRICRGVDDLFGRPEWHSPCRSGFIVGTREALAAEIQALDMAALVDHQVLRLDVAVNHSLFGCMLESLRGLAREVRGHRNRQRPFPIDHAIEARALDELHDEEMPAAGL